MPEMKSVMLLLALLCAAPAAHAQISVVGKLTLERQAAAGDRYTGTVSLLNAGQKSQAATLYQKDYAFNADGVSTFGEPGSAPRSNASWVSFTPNRITIPAGQRAEVSYTVTVPREAALRGTYWSVLFVEQVPDEPEALPEARPETFRLSVRQVIRYAVQIVTTVGSSARSDLRFQNARTARDGTARVLKVDAENRGEVWLGPHLYVDLYDLMGGYAGRREGGTHRVYPGCSVRAVFPLGDIAPGTYKALVVADAGGEDIFGVSYSLTVEP
jgi:hypothetical protein